MMVSIFKKVFIKYGPLIFGQKFYGKWFYDAINEDNLRSHPSIADELANRFKPSFVLDFGCGDGILLYELKKKGIAGLGYENADYGIKLCRDKGVDFIKFDFTQKTAPDFKRNVDIVISLEVAEHFLERYADFYYECLSKYNDAKVLFFSAARVGQTGEGHVNEQPPEYWAEKFAKQGWTRERVLTEELSLSLKKKGVSWYYWQNLQVFTR